ncbi:MAG: VOC family protein [Pseudomonadota bacterium]|nr:VOC family protein [Pseudomonadota bacterium]
MQTAGAPLATMDHLVLAAITLADGIDYVASLTGAVPHPGGKHVTMGTHNALLRLGDKLFVEVIAIDPTAPKLARARWFGLDGIALQAELQESPRLIHWVARTRDLDSAARRSGVELGPVHALERGDYRWRITIPDDGALPGKGLIPTLIQWDVPAHPADALPKSPVSLIELAGTHPDPNAVRGVLAKLGLERDLRVTYDREPKLAAMLRTPKGIVTFS